MSNRRSDTISISLDYYVGTDIPGRIYRNFPVDPRFTDELVLAVRPDLAEDAETVGGIQVHLAGSARALEELGRYLIAMARLTTSDPEPYGSFDDVKNQDGGSARLLPRRLGGS